MRISQLVWEEPNRRKTPPLHISDRGARFSTLTGASWLTQNLYVVAHRSGLRVALFHINQTKPLKIFSVTHLTDDVAVKKITDKTWEISISGCWDVMYSTYSLNLDREIQFQLKTQKNHENKTFCHGVAYDPRGNLCLTLHTGDDPRIYIGTQETRLPTPWGARSICFDQNSGFYYVVAVSNNPQLNEYSKVATSIWRLFGGA